MNCKPPGDGSDLRDRHKGRVVTFSPKVFVPLTNLCRDFCGYCTFRKAPDEAGAKTMTIDEVLRVVRRASCSAARKCSLASAISRKRFIRR